MSASEWNEEAVVIGEKQIKLTLSGRGPRSLKMTGFDLKDWLDIDAEWWRRNEEKLGKETTVNRSGKEKSR